MGKKIIYISGKIGCERITKAIKDKFHAAAKKLQTEGWLVINPTHPDFQKEMKRSMTGNIEDLGREGLPVDRYSLMLLYDLTVLSHADAIYMLPDFLSSPGAKAEHAFAVACGKTVIYDEELYERGILRR